MSQTSVSHSGLGTGIVVAAAAAAPVSGGGFVSRTTWSLGLIQSLSMTCQHRLFARK